MLCHILHHIKHFKGYAVNKKIIDDLVKETGSYLDAYLHILRAPYEPLVEDITRHAVGTWRHAGGQ